MINWNRFLPFWAANMLRIRGAGMDWFGFRYSAAEWAQMETLGKPVSLGAYRAFVTINAILFIVMAGILMAVVLVPVLSALYPDPAQTSAVVFFSVLGVIILFCFAIGLPSTMAISAAVLGGKLPAITAVNQALVARVRWQILRMGLFVTAIAFALIGISIGFGIDLAPWLREGIRIASFAISALTLFLVFKKR